MKALRYDGKHGLRLEEVPSPEPGRGEVLIEVRAVGICRTDIEIVEGSHPFYAGGGPEQPLTPGHEWSGVVVGHGEGVTDPPVGTLVTGETGIGCGVCDLCRIGRHNACLRRVESGILGRDGAMRELHVHPATHTHPCPGLTADEAALVEPASVGVWAAERAGVRPGDRVIVLGGGSIGQMAMQAARAFGATEVLLATRSPEKRALAEALGADRTFDASAGDFVAAVRDHTRGDGVHVVIEASGNIQSLRDALDLARPLARIVILGVFDQPWVQEISPLVSNEYTLLPSVGSPGVWPLTISLMEQGRIQAGPIISGKFPLADYREAFEVVSRGGPQVLKCLLAP